LKKKIEGKIMNTLMTERELHTPAGYFFKGAVLAAKFANHGVLPSLGLLRFLSAFKGQLSPFSVRGYLEEAEKSVVANPEIFAAVKEFLV
jgi:hypothetical protein